MKTLILVALSLLAACSAQKVEKELTVSRSFLAGNSYSTGGIIIHGEHLDSKRTFTYPLSTDADTKINLEVGNWRFSAIGWEGSTKFDGEPSCALTTVNLQTNTTIDLNTTAANCLLPEFTANFSVKDVLVKSCEILKDYNIANNEFFQIASDNYCDPDNTAKAEFLKSSLLFYRVYPVDTLTKSILSDEETLGDPSSCVAQFSGTPQRLKLPTKKLPLHVKMYKTFADCQGETDRNVDFTFKSGLLDGDIAKFDHHYSVDTGTNARLFLPSSVTRRGTSPFMNMIPRVLCSGSDCFSGLNLDKHYVDWKNDLNYKTLFANVSTAACNTFTTTASSNFSVSNCKVENGLLKAQIKRNEFMCQNSRMYELNPNQTIVSMHYKAGKIYILRAETSSSISRVDVFSTSGSRLGTLQLPLLTGYSGIAADSTGKIYIANNQQVEVYQFDALNNFIFLNNLSIPAAKIDISSDGQYLFYDSLSGGNLLRSYKIANGEIKYISVPGLTVQKFQWHDSHLYYLDSNDPTLWKVPHSGGNFGTPIEIIVDENNMRTFTVDRTRIVIRGYDSDDDDIQSTYETSPSLMFKDYQDDVFLWNSGSNNMISDDNGKVYYLAGTGEIEVLEAAGGSYAYNKINSTSSSCSGTITVASEGNNRALNLKTTVGSSAYNIVSSIYDILGYRSLANRENAKFTFEFLNENDKDEDNKSGGQLRKAQQMLSPNGLAGLLSEYENCSALRDHINTLPGKKLQKVLSLQNKFDDEVLSGTLDVTIPAGGTRINNYLCDDTSSLTSTCSTDYSLILNLAFTEGTRSEKMIMKLRCDKKLGTLETYEEEVGAKTHHSLTMWNTTDSSAARFEKYQYDTTSTGYSGSVYKVVKTAPDAFWSRDIHYSELTDTPQGSVRQLQKDFSRFLTSQYTLADSGVSSSASLGNTNAKECMDKTNANLSFAPLVCPFSPPVGVEKTSTNVDFSIDALLTSNANGIRNKFEINP